jgi:hypothetical protein
MKNSLRLAALAGILGLTSWLSISTPAHALQACTNYAGKGCSPAGSKVSCTISGDPIGECICGTNFRWVCYY